MLIRQFSHNALQLIRFITVSWWHKCDPLLFFFDIEVNVKRLFPSLQLLLLFFFFLLPLWRVSVNVANVHFGCTCKYINYLYWHKIIIISHFFSNTLTEKIKIMIKPSNKWCILVYSYLCGHTSHFTWKRFLYKHSDFHIEANKSDLVKL